MSPEHREVVDLLLQKARDNLSAARTLVANEGQADHVIGNQLQQAIEKALKAVLASRELEIPHTHNLAFLVEQIEAADIDLDLPEVVKQSSWLTPWAVDFRYDEEGDDLDRDAALAAATAAVALAEEVVEKEG